MYYATGLPAFARSDIIPAQKTSREDEIKMLEQEKNAVKQELDLIQKRIEELRK
jgi:hypothetical protein